MCQPSEASGGVQVSELHEMQEHGPGRHLKLIQACVIRLALGQLHAMAKGNFSLPYNAMVRFSKQTAGRSSIASSGEALSPRTSRAQTAGRLVDELEPLRETFNNTSSFRKVAAALTLSGAEDAQVTQLAEISEIYATPSLSTNTNRSSRSSRNY